MKVNNLVIAISFVVLAVSFWNRNSLPGKVEYVAEIAQEPKQLGTSERPFDAVFKDVSYRVEPEYAYDITGMIVSYRHHD
ncbi:MAG: hypothetical protein EX272_11525, partial [Chromatiales bacterium]